MTASEAYPHTQRPPEHWTRLQKLVWTLRKHGNEPDNLNLEVLASHNKWTDVEQLLVEFKIQQNGTRKLPEEMAATASPIVKAEEAHDE